MSCTITARRLAFLTILAGFSNALPLAPDIALSQLVTITVQADKPGAKINSSMWGAFFEDINFGADGGLNADLVKNGTFEFPDSMMGWFKISPSNTKGDVTIETTSAYRDGNPHYVRIANKSNPPLGISNEGYRDMGVRAGDAYDFAAQMRVTAGRPRVTVEIVGEDGTLLAEEPLSGLDASWKKISATLRRKTLTATPA